MEDENVSISLVRERSHTGVITQHIALSRSGYKSKLFVKTSSWHDYFSWGLYYRTFCGCNLWIFIISWSVYPGKPFQSNIMFASYAGACLSEAPFKLHFKIGSWPRPKTLD
jgi:hypothetical protein